MRIVELLLIPRRKADPASSENRETQNENVLRREFLTLQYDGSASAAR